MNTPPIAQQKPHESTIHGHTRVDNYFWLREKNNPEVVEYLRTENEYTHEQLLDTNELQQKLFAEMKSRIKENDATAPAKSDAYFYYSRTEAEKQYPIFCRKYLSLDAPEEILLDQNILADGHAYCAIGVLKMSPDHRLLAYSVDMDGSETFTIYIKNVQDGTLLAEQILDTTYSLAWAADSKSFFYTMFDVAHRADKIRRHVIGQAVAEDTQVYEDPDERYDVSVSKTLSEQYIVITSQSKETSESHVIDARTPDAAPRIIHAREANHRYAVDHRDELFYIMTDRDGLNFKIVTAPTDAPQFANWRELIPHRTDVALEEFHVFKNFMIVHEMKEGLITLRVHEFEKHADHLVEMPDIDYAVHHGANHEFETSAYRFVYSSLITPPTTFDYDVAARERHVIKIQEVSGDYDARNYMVERAFVTATDGARIPVSIAYKRGLEKNSANPLWLDGYGAYGTVYSSGFKSSRIAMLDRGFMIAIAHVRGGGEGGRAWYDAGKYFNKKNTFADFISVAEFLVAEKYTTPKKIICVGRSAGGLLIGASVNMRPALFGAAILDVPFVDVVNTMMDPTIPLTVGEYEEWGNPEHKNYYDYMLSYSPYENIRAQEYPHMLVQGGLHDPRVQYWEPAKFVAQLRVVKTDTNLLLLNINMGAGHGGASGRYDFLKEVALEYAFALKVL